MFVCHGECVVNLVDFRIFISVLSLYLELTSPTVKHKKIMELYA